MNSRQLDSLIEQHVNQSSYRPVKPRVIAKQLKLSEKQKHNLKSAIKRLARQGRLRYAQGQLVYPAARNRHGQIVGVFQRAAGGYGFVRRKNSESSQRSSDVFIPASRTLDAASGDTVAVRVRRRGRGRDDRTRGEIVEVLERATRQFVGTYFENHGVGFVEVDANRFRHSIQVGDAGSKNAADGDKVTIEIVRFPSVSQTGEAVITEVLGRPGNARIDTRLIMREFGLPESFPIKVIENAREQADKFDGRIPDNRRDLTQLTAITIDPRDARDFDDAVSLTRMQNGHWKLGVHIADVGHFVPRNSPLDREARERGTSVYLPDRVIPMLPETISNNLASLQPNQVRFTTSAFIEFTSEGARVSTDLVRGAIKSKHRFTYEDIDLLLENRERQKPKLAEDIRALVDRMYELAMILRRRRRERGAIDLALPEIKLDLDDDGEVKQAIRVEYTDSHKIIEEFMLSANEAVAEFLEDQEIQFLRRIHSSPDPRKLQDLTTFVRQLGFDAENLQNRFEIKQVLEQVAERPERDAVNFAVLRSMQKATYSPIEEGHYALASPCYCHFTSPIRRYPDLTIHRLINDVLDTKPTPTQASTLIQLGEQCSDRERRAEEAERELIKLKLLGYLKSRIGTTMQGIITGVTEIGLYVQGRPLPAEGFIPVGDLEDDHYFYDSATHTLEGHRTGSRYRLGDPLEVAIHDVDLDRREMELRLTSQARDEVRQTNPESNRRRRTKVGKKPTNTRRHALKKRRTKKKRK